MPKDHIKKWRFCWTKLFGIGFSSEYYDAPFLCIDLGWLHVVYAKYGLPYILEKDVKE